MAWAVSMVAALTLVAIGAQAGRNAACAAEIGDCSLSGVLRGDLVAAVSPREYAGSAACGAYLDVTGPRGTVRVQVIDECPSCAPGELDLSRSAFARIARPGDDAVRVGYHTVRNPDVPRPVAFRLKIGSSARWLAIQAVDHGNPLRALEVRKDGRWEKLSRDSGNYWVAPQGIGSGPYTVRITDVYGQRLTASGIDLAAGRLQRTTRRLYEPSATTQVSRTYDSDKVATRHDGRRLPEAGNARARGSRTKGDAESTGAASRGKEAKGMLDTHTTVIPGPSAGRAPLAALPSARPFFC